ncbi:MAG: L,D-transpeptidase family protein [Halobacteria archaeon]|nr:L,D-transpeptidase family protein [Halobacteria archaeon]
MALPLSRFGFYFLVVVAGMTIAAQVQPQLEPRPDSISTALHGQLQTASNTTIGSDLNWPLLTRFYASRQYQPLWLNALGPKPKAWQWRYFLQTADQEGLDPRHYHPAAIAEHWQSDDPWELASLDLLLTDAFLRYSVDQSHGHLEPRDVDPVWDIPKSKADPLALLRSTLAKDDFDAAVRDLAPPHLGYQRLRRALAQYQQLARLGGWPPLAAGPWLEYGSYDPEVGFLRKRLMIEGDLKLRPVRDELIFDRALKHAVERFQVRHGLKMDGIVGPATRAAMNVPVSKRIEQIKLNMDRWRWLPRELGKRYIMVNTAGYELAAMEDNRPIFTMWVIIGTPERQTPVISGKLHTVVFNPYWTVPPTILFEDMLPAQQYNPNFLASRGIRVFSNHSNAQEVDPRDIDWSQVDKKHFPYVLRQDPGATNPLGRMKFLFDNEYNIYLHDTPKQRLFNRNKRAFSSGCVRVEKPVQLAEFVLGSGGGWDQGQITETINSDRVRGVRVKERVPVYLVYWTAWVAEDEAVFFRPDVYERDHKNGIVQPPKL